jgi:hypothetical protein
MSIARRLLSLGSLIVVGALVYVQAVGDIVVRWEGVVDADADSVYGLLKLLFAIWLVRLAASRILAWRPGLAAWLALVMMPAIYFWHAGDEFAQRSGLSITACALLALALLVDVLSRGRPRSVEAAP